MTSVRQAMHVIAPAESGGAESVVVALACATPDRVAVAVLDQTRSKADPAHPLAELLRSRGVTVDEIRCGRRRYFAEISSLAGLLRSRRPDVVHAHGYHGNIVGHYAANRAHIPAVLTVHGYLGRNWKERFYDRMDKWVLRRSARVIAVSEVIRDQLLRAGISSSRIALVRNGMDSLALLGRHEAREQLQLSNAEFVIGWIGRFSVEKGPDLFIQTLARAGTAGCAVMIGDGPELVPTQELASKHSLTASSRPLRLLFAGAVHAASKLMPAIDLLVLSSRSEGTPMVLLEAISAGVPIAAFRVGGVPELLSDSSAFLAPKGDVAALARAITDASTDPDSRARRAAAARVAAARSAGLQQWVSKVWAVYDDARASAT